MAMKNLFTLLFALLAATVLVSAQDSCKKASDWGRQCCINKSPSVQKAIEAYCGRGGFHIPSVRGNWPKQVNNAVISINGGCNPAQWLPWDICFKQFYRMCYTGNARGENKRQYGRGKKGKKCQNWEIKHPL